MSKRWIRADLCKIQEKLKYKTHITSSSNKGYRIIKSWIVNHLDSGELRNILEVK